MCMHPRRVLLTLLLTARTPAVYRVLSVDQWKAFFDKTDDSTKALITSDTGVELLGQLRQCVERRVWFT